MITTVDIILLHLVRSQQVIGRCANIISPEDFSAPGEEHAGIIYDVALEWYKANKTAMPELYMDTALNERIVTMQAYMSDAAITRIYGTVKWIYACDVGELNVAHAINLIQQLVDTRQIRQLAANLGNSQDPEEFTSDMDRLRQAHQSTRLSGVENMNHLFVPGHLSFSNTIRTPTGVPFIDTLFNGGTAAGEMYGILAPTGGGKTTIASMLYCELAKQRRHAALFSYETELQPQVTNKIYGYMGQIQRDDLRITDISEMDPAAADRLTKALALYCPYMHVYDMKKDVGKGIGCGGVPELRNQVDALRQAGTKVEVVIIDQLLSLVDSYVMRTNAAIENRRVYLQGALEELRDMSSEMNCCTFVLHQVDNNAKGSSPMRIPRSGDAAEVKDFENNMTFCLQFGVRDTHSRMSWLSTIKAREGTPQDIVVEMDKDLWQLNWEPDKFKYDSVTKSFIKLLDGKSDTSMESAREADTSAPVQPELDDTLLDPSGIQ